MTYPTSESGTTNLASDAAGTAQDVSPEPRYGVFECPECDAAVLAVGEERASLSCHDRSMRRVTDVEMDIETPDLREVLLEAFGLPKVGLDICLCVIGEGPLSANEVGDALGYDRSTVTRYLNELVDQGLLRRSQLNREAGGVVNVYHSVDVERMRRQTLLGFCVWAGEAATLIEAANLTKQRHLEANSDQSLPAVFWESFSGE